MSEGIYGFSRNDYDLVRKAVRHVLVEMKQDEKPKKGQRAPRATSFIPLRLAKLQSGQSLDGTSPSQTALANIYSGDPGSEVVVKEGVTVSQARQLGSGETISDSDWIIVGIVDRKYQLVSPRTTGGGGGPAVKLVRLSSALDATPGASASADVYTGTVGSETDSGANTTVYRTRLMQSPEEIPSGAYVYTVELNGLDQVFAVALQVTLLTAFRVDGATRKLQYKTRTATVLTAGDESDWVDAHTGTNC